MNLNNKLSTDQMRSCKRGIATPWHPKPAQAYARDHGNDVLLNTFAVAGVFLGTEVAWWLDPAAASLLSIYIASKWFASAQGNVKVLTGRLPLFSPLISDCIRIHSG